MVYFYTWDELKTNCVFFGTGYTIGNVEFAQLETLSLVIVKHIFALHIFCLVHRFNTPFSSSD
jgi:hypothetical protein